MELNTAETNDFDYAKKEINNLRGTNTTYFFRDFFSNLNRSVSPRVAIRLSEDVRKGLIPGVSLVGKTSASGYHIL